MEVNKEEALRSLSIAQARRNAGNLAAALKFANKSVSLYPTPEGQTMVTIIEKEISVTGNGNGDASASASSSAKATGVEEHLTSAHARHKKPADAPPPREEEKKKRTYTVKQMETVTRIKRCGETQYYEILQGEPTVSTVQS